MNQKTYTYYCRLRPPMMGCIPKKDLISINFDEITFNNRTYWGSVTYKEEVKNYSDYDLDYFE